MNEVDKIDKKISRRSFFGRAVAAVGVIAAAGYVKTLISGSTPEVAEKYTNDAALQEIALMGNRLVVMTDAEKQQRLDELLGCHYKELS